MLKDITLARWPIVSMMSMSGASAIMGPRKCLMYFFPWYLMPMGMGQNEGA